jgi:tetratricopeptide (TPR) repeat protein
MVKQSFILSFKIIAIISAYYILSIYFRDLYIIIGVLAISVPIIVYNLMAKGSFEYVLEVLCDPDRYLDMVQKKYANKEGSVYQTYLAYAYVYQGDYVNALSAINRVDKKVIEEKPKLNLIYYIVLLKLAYNDNDLEMYSTLFSEVQKIELEETEKIELRVFDVPIYLLEKKYEEVIELLKDLIPLQRKRFLVMELEYYLAFAYLKVDNKEDAIAVLEFLSNERYRLVHNELGRKLLEELNKPL